MESGLQMEEWSSRILPARILGCESLSCWFRVQRQMAEIGVILGCKKSFANQKDNYLGFLLEQMAQFMHAKDYGPKKIILGETP